MLGAASCLVLLTQQHVEIYLRGAALLLVGLGLWGVNELLMRRLGAARADEPRSRLAR